MASRVRAVLLDAGGTLLRLRGQVGEIYAATAERYGVSLDASELETRFTAAFAAMPPLSFGGVPPSALVGLERRWWRRLVAQVMPPERFGDFDGLFDELFAYFGQPDAWQLFPESLTTLAALRDRQLQLAIVSNFDARLFRLCDELGLAARVHAVIASSRIGYAKPDRRIFHLTLRRLGVPPAEALHVGDSPVEDVDGARAAGLQALQLDRGGSGGGDTIHDLSQILEHL